MRMALKISSLTASLVMFALGSALPAEAQFMMSYPAIIVVPPAQLCSGEARQQVGGARQAKSFRRPTGARADDNISRPDRRSLDGCRLRPMSPSV